MRCLRVEGGGGLRVALREEGRRRRWGAHGTVSVKLERCVLQLPHIIQRQWRVDAKMVEWLENKSRRFASSVLCEGG